MKCCRSIWRAGASGALALVFLAALWFAATPVHAQTGAGMALAFDGVNDYVSISNSAALNTYPLTVAAWMKTGQFGGFIGVINKYFASSDNGWLLQLHNGNITAYYMANSGNNVSGLDGGWVVDGLWRHVAFAVDASGGKLYVNGALRDFRPWTGTPAQATTTQELSLGRYPGGGNFFNGTLDEVSVWNVALTQNAIEGMMNRRLATNETGLLAYWRFDETSGIATADAEPDGAGNNLGTLVGGPTRVVSEVQISPLVSTTQASQQGLTSARLNGAVTALGLDTTAWFEWGATTNYGNLTPPVNVGNASTSVVMNADITGQFQGQTNHFRLVATNSNGRVNGVNASFSIPAFPGPAGTPPLRSTLYDGFLSQVSYEARPEWDQSVSMTVEAWVYRHDANRVETIVSHGPDLFSPAPGSYRLGFSPRLRFYRGTNYAEIPTPVPAFKWTHLAVSYDGTIARFYINGEFAGGRTLGNNGAGKSRPLLLGYGGYSSQTFFPVEVFLGNLDEVRVWSVARSATEIREGMYREARGEPGLTAAIPRGGRVEVVSGLVGYAGGVTEQIFGMVPRDLVVPRAAIQPVANGLIDLASEYLGAEQLVIRYPDDPTAADAIASFVHTDDDLFVAVGNQRPGANGSDAAQNWLGLFLDPTYARPALAQRAQVQIQTALLVANNSNFYLNGDGDGGFSFCTNFLSGIQPCTPAGLWQVGKLFCGFELAPPCVEFRVSRAVLGSFDEFDGVAFGHFNHDGLGGQAFTPEEGFTGSPATWLTMSYGQGSANLPRVRISGRVFGGVATNGNPLLAGHRVSFFAGGAAYSQLSDAFGRYSFDVPMPAGQVIYAQVDNVGFGRYRLPSVRTTGVQPAFVFTNDVRFPAIASGFSGTLQLAGVDFFVQKPLPSSAITSASPTNPMAGIAVRQGGVGGLGEWVTLTGTNLHAEMEYYLSPMTGTFPTSPGAWTLIRAANVERVDSTTVRVQTPFVPDFVRQHTNGPFVPSFQSPWQWVAGDAWFRAGQIEYSTVGTFTLRRPPYPILHGFSFDNEDHDALLNEFLAGYGYSAYICVGPVGDCGAHIPDPLYWSMWWPVHKIVIDKSTGSCVGFSGTAMELFNLLEIPQTYDPEALFANGIDNPGAPGEFDTSNTGGRYTRPPIPKDIWARIRMNHGAQTSAEYLNHLISQLDVDVFSPNFGGDPVARLPELRAGTTAQAVCMVQGFEGGHCVSPYRVEGNFGGDPNITRIWIYDNNSPCAIGAAADDSCVTNRFIDIDHSANEYIFPGSSWTGTALFTVPSRLYTGTRTAPGLYDFALALGSFLVVVAGDADAHFTAPGGREWGWRKDGTFVNNLPGLKAIPILGTPTNLTRSIPILLPISNGIPAIDIHMRGSNANVFHVAAGGTMLQLEMAGSTPGHSNRIRLTAISNQLSSFRFTPQTAISNFTPRIGFAISNGACATFQWLGLDAVSNKTQEFRALKSRRAVDYRNDSGKPTQHYLRVDAVDAGTTNNTCAVFGPFDVPTGAVHCVVLHDWPRTKQARSELDLNGDGVPEQVTIVTGTAIDSDGDGIPDAWETLHQLDPERIDCDDDADNDGVSNLGEYLTDTDPRDPASALRLTATMLPGNKVRLSWKAVPGRRYEIQYANGLEYVFQPLAAAGLPRVATSTEEHFDETLPAGVTRPRFYRLRVVP